MVLLRLDKRSTQTQSVLQTLISQMKFAWSVNSTKVGEYNLKYSTEAFVLHLSCFHLSVLSAYYITLSIFAV